MRGAIAVGLVVFQGLLGGITVIYKLPPEVSTTHLGVSFAFFGYLLWIVFRLREVDAPRLVLPLSLRRWVAFAAGAVYVQSLVGALMRHLGAGLACVDLPLCRGAVWPAQAVNVSTTSAAPTWVRHGGERILDNSWLMRLFRGSWREEGGVASHRRA